MDKYTYTGKCKTVDYRNKKLIVSQIVALKDFKNIDGELVEKGTVGGYILRPTTKRPIERLSQAGKCWVNAGSIVIDAYVLDDAIVVDSYVEKGEISGSAKVISSIVKDGKIEGFVSGSHIDGKVRSNASVLQSNIEDGSKIGKNVDENESSESVTITNSTISGTYVAGDSIIKNSEIKTNYKLVNSKIENCTLYDTDSSVEEKTLNLKNFSSIELQDIDQD